MNIHRCADEDVVAIVGKRYRGEDRFRRGLRFLGKDNVHQGCMMEWRLDDDLVREYPGE